MLLDARRLTKLYGSVIGLNEVDLQLPKGAHGLLGPNGAGKSTLVNIMTGQLLPTLGSVKVLGEEPWNNGALLSRIGYCPTSDIALPRVSAIDWVVYLLQLGGMGKAMATEKAAHELEQMGLAKVMNQPLRDYSKGMRQRAKLAQALAHDPELLILDEPFNGLDPIGRYEVTERFVKWVDQGKSLLLASHILHEVEAIADSFLLICGGRILASGDVEGIRTLLADVPSEIVLRCDHPRRLAAEVVGCASVSGIQLLNRDSLQVATQQALEFYQQLPELCVKAKVVVSEMHSPDGSLEQMFESLMKLHRGEVS